MRQLVPDGLGQIDAGEVVIEKRGGVIIAGALQRAAKAERILSLPLENTVRLSTAARNSASEYGANKLVQATIGDLAERYAGFLGVPPPGGVQEDLGL